jgi:hypothetical protein
MRVRFLKTVIYETRGRNDGPVYDEGSVHDLTADEAERWLRRGVAEPARAEPVDVAPASDPEPVAEPASEAKAEPVPRQPKRPFGRR